MKELDVKVVLVAISAILYGCASVGTIPMRQLPAGRRSTEYPVPISCKSVKIIDPEPNCDTNYCTEVRPEMVKIQVPEGVRPPDCIDLYSEILSKTRWKCEATMIVPEKVVIVGSRTVQLRLVKMRW